ncbi:DNA-binding protein [uncultured Porphyromonas sp.]|uniref:DNA-binding protein n=1 Tax=uncultured Porphyromonas sp. TaxID=159274 RepID=UPI0026190072|nr:DNA-binding protein [uncultured Porphyromonas sp.]
MEFISVKDFAAAYGVSERTVRNYCLQGKIAGAQLVGKTWSIPADTLLPQRKRRLVSPLLEALREQMSCGLKGGIYHRTQVDLTYNSNHIEGSRLTKEQTRYIFETKTMGVSGTPIRVDDIIETTNHFRCIDFIIEHAEEPLSEGLIKRLHALLKRGTSDADRSWFAVGDYKRLPNEVGGRETVAPEEVAVAMRALLREYNGIGKVVLEDILDFHYRLEVIHPFQDGNGRVGRLIMFKECLAHGIVPFIITEELKMFYYRGLDRWKQTPGYLIDTCLTAQDQYKSLLNYFRIPHR